MIGWSAKRIIIIKKSLTLYLRILNFAILWCDSDAVPTFEIQQPIKADFQFYVKHSASSEAGVRRGSVKKVFLEISQNSQENTCARVSFLKKLQALGLQFY